MPRPSLSTCVCGLSIPSTSAYCGAKACLEDLLAQVEHLFDPATPKHERIHFIQSLPISVTLSLGGKGTLDFTSLPDETREVLLNSPTTPVELLFQLVVVDRDRYLPFLKEHNRLRELGKEVRRKNFSQEMIGRLRRASPYLPIFLYHSREDPFWRGVMDRLLTSHFTPEQVLIYLEYLFRGNHDEYLKTYRKLRQNSRLTRLIFIINSSQEKLVENKLQNTTQEGQEGQENHDGGEEEEAKLSGYKLENYASHWFPDVRLAVAKHWGVFRSTLEKLFYRELEWSNHSDPELDLSLLSFLDLDSPTSQRQSPVLQELLLNLIRHPKVPPKLLREAAGSTDALVRQAVALHSTSLPTLSQLASDLTPTVQIIASVRKDWLASQKQLEKDIDEDGHKPFLLSTKQVLSVLSTRPSTHQL